MEHARHLGWFEHRGGHLGHRLGDALDVHGLEVFLVQAGARGLAGDAQDGNGVGNGRVQTGDHVGAGRARGADAHADVAGLGPGVALGHVRGAFHVARQDVGDALALTQGGVQRVDGCAGHAEGIGHAFFFHHEYGCHCGFHLGHVGLLERVGG